MEKGEKMHLSSDKVPENLEITVTKNGELILSLVGNEVILKNGYEVSINSLT